MCVEGAAACQAAEDRGLNLDLLKFGPPMPKGRYEVSRSWVSVGVAIVALLWE
jgi:hypothetical protein